MTTFLELENYVIENPYKDHPIKQEVYSIISQTIGYPKMPKDDVRCIKE
jgi:hypothetical protein